MASNDPFDGTEQTDETKPGREAQSDEQRKTMEDAQRKANQRGAELNRQDGQQGKRTAMTAAGADAQFKAMFEKALPSIAQIASKHLSPERLLRIALVARSRTPGLRDCAPQSFLQALMQAAEVGLEPNTPLQHAWIIPYRNRKTGTTEAQFQVGYKGLIHMARRSGMITTARARLVREGDVYDVVEGTERKLVHRPSQGERGEILFGYAVAELTGGGVEWDTMRLDDMNAIRARSKSSNDGPWSTDTDMMYRKTVLKRVLGQLDLTEEMATAIEVDRGADEGASDATVIDILAGGAPQAQLGSGDKGEDLSGEIVRGKAGKR